MSDTSGVPRPVVIVVDDEPGFRELLSYELEARGYDVSAASGGDEGLALAREKSADLVLCDLTMPGRGGLDTLRALKQLDGKMEVIITTGNATLEVAVDAMRQGAYDFITKPFRLEELCRVIDRALEKRRLSVRLGVLETMNRVKTEFLANMSHELRTPLNALMGYTALLLEESYGPLTDKQRQSLGRMEANAKNLLHLINNVLDLSKLNAGRMSLYREPFLTSELFKEITDTMASLAREKKVELVCAPAEDVRLWTDKTKVKQILINLVGNAIKFTDQGQVTLRAEKPAGLACVKIEVMDTGVGIAPQDLPLLFQEYTQLEAPSQREHSGTGLGLSIVKKMTEFLGGTVEAKSELGRGTVFSVVLPVGAALTEVPLPAQAAEPNPEPKTGDRVLLAIDDDADVLALLRESVKETGFVFVGALSGEEGLALARKYHPAIITLDIMMPRQDGWSLLQTLKNDPELKKIPVMIVSIMENKTLGFSLGVSDYLVKPFTRQELVERLKALDDTRTPQRVLVVDDDAFATELLRQILEKQGFTVNTAGGGREALRLMSEEKPDILFLDLMMPHMSGFEVLEEIEKDHKYDNVRVFVITAKHLTPQETEYLQRRAEAVVQKGTRSVAETLEALKGRLALVGLSR